MMAPNADGTDQPLQALLRIEMIVRETLQNREQRSIPAVHPSIVRAKAAYAARRQRNKAFGEMDELFEEPGWDMLLDLFIALHEGRRVCVSDACIAACVPHSTALRYVSVLERHGLVKRVRDPGDRRRMFLELTSAGTESMVKALMDRPAATSGALGASHAKLGSQPNADVVVAATESIAKLHSKVASA